MLNFGETDFFTKSEKKRLIFVLPLYNNFWGGLNKVTSYRYLEEQKSKSPSSPSYLNSDLRWVKYKFKVHCVSLFT